jgi:Na+/H+ antiporter NhaD/arsenite permease-like protein
MGAKVARACGFRTKAARAPLALAAAAVLAPQPAFAAELDGASLSLVWALPFVGMLLSIALGPLLAPHAWERHQGKIAALWAALALVPLAIFRSPGVAVNAAAHTLLLEYIPFVLLLLALFTTAGGIVLRGNLHGSPVVNATMLAIGAALASVIGTTGASMVMIRPVLRANDDRKHNAHVVIFFIFLVSNIGGSLTPLGDPPLFLGYLRGVDFFWTTSHLLHETLFVAIIVLALFFALDSYIFAKEGRKRRDPTPDAPLRVSGLPNMALIGAVIVAILVAPKVDLGAFTLLGQHILVANLLRDAVFVAVVFASLMITRRADHEANGFSFGPIIEVAKLFVGIFLSMAPVLAMLKAGASGAFAPLVALTSTADGAPNPAAYFWMTGVLSSFLDNAPTYLVFFELGGGDAKALMTSGALTLAAISTGAVFMGANSYIGNAPNFMVYAIARSGGVRMPSFFGYMLWSGVVLVPVFVLVTFVFF